MDLPFSLTFLLDPFIEFSFMRRALVGAEILAISGAPLGVFLLLRRMTLAGDAMSHAILPGAALGYLLFGLSLGAMGGGGLLAGCSVALAAAAVTRGTNLQEDASFAGFYLISLAFGVSIVSIYGSKIDLLNILFGNVLALDNMSLFFLAGVGTLTLLFLACLYRPLVVESVDPHFLKSVSRWGAPTQLLFIVLVALNLVGGFQALGTLLSVGLMILPAAAARLWSVRLTTTIFMAIMMALTAGYFGLVFSFYAHVPSGPAIVLCAGGIYLISLIFGVSGGLLRRLPEHVHLEK